MVPDLPDPLMPSASGDQPIKKKSGRDAGAPRPHPPVVVPTRGLPRICRVLVVPVIVVAGAVVAGVPRAGVEAGVGVPRDLLRHRVAELGAALVRVVVAVERGARVGPG